jgi:hypothetical protein
MFLILFLIQKNSKGGLSGLQFSLNLCNVCGFQDRLFLVVFACSTSSAVDNEGSITGDAQENITKNISSFRWNQIARTEVLLYNSCVFSLIFLTVHSFR